MRAAKNSACFWMFKESRPQTPSPLIRPADSDFGGAERGKVKIEVVMTQVTIKNNVALQDLTLAALVAYNIPLVASRLHDPNRAAVLSEIITLFLSLSLPSIKNYKESID